MKLALTIDVEEEGLFQGKYARGDAPTENVRDLMSLDSLFREWDIRPTLLVSYQVIRHKIHQDLLALLSERWGAEIGAHLHPWNTPPLQELPYPEPVPSELIPKDLLAAKLQALLDTMKKAGFAPVSFRMGRFNFGPNMFSLLEKISDIQVDSSIAPLRRYYGGPVYLGLKTDPYFPNPSDPLQSGTSHILEVPITIVPLLPRLARLMDWLDRTSIFPDRWIPELTAKVVSLSIQPMWTGLCQLKAAVKLHERQGGRVLTTHFHSSEIMVGGCPQHSTRAQVDQFLARLSHFLSWLRKDINVEPVTLSELGAIYRAQRISYPKQAAKSDCATK